MSKEINLHWICPNCKDNVDFENQLKDVFDENGESEFIVEENCGLYFHTIFCPKCNANWVMSIGGMNKDTI